MDGGQSLDHALDEVPFGRPHVWILVTLALIGLIEAYATGMTGVLVVAAKSSLQMPVSDVPWLVIAPTGSLIAGGLACAVYFQDRVSRKTLLLIGVIWSCVFTLATAGAATVSQLLVIRVLSGFGYGLALPAAYPIGAEGMPPKRRSTAGWVYEASLGTGLTLVFVAAAALVHSPEGWRVVPLPSALMLVILPLLIVKKIPESPRWLMSRGRTGAAWSVVNRARAQAGLDKVVATAAPADRPHPATPLATLVQPGNLSHLVLAITVYTCATVPFYVFSTLMPALLIRQGFAEVASFAFTVLLFAVTIPGKILNGFLMEALGRQKTIALALTTSLIALALGVADPSSLGFTSMEVLLGLSVLSSYPAVRMYMVEQFPTERRGRGYFMAEMVGRFLAGVMVSFVLASHLADPGVIYGAIAAFAIVGAGAPLVYGRKDTRGPLMPTAEAPL